MKRLIYSKSEAPVSFKVVFVRFLFILALIFSVAYNVMLWLKYERLQEMVIVEQLPDEVILDKNGATTKQQAEIDSHLSYPIFTYRPPDGINKEYNKLNAEILHDLEIKREKVEKKLESLEASTMHAGE